MPTFNIRVADDREQVYSQPKVLMRNGEWLVPGRPTLAEAPKEMSKDARKIDAWISPVNNIGGVWGRKRGIY